MTIELRHIHKHFGPVHANNDISLVINSGSIHGVLGENGAGKSTLMKILSGFIQADEGQILIDGKQVQIKSPDDAIKQGIGMLHQDPLDFPPMRIVDNFITGQPGGLFFNRKKVSEEIKSLSKDFDFQLNPDSFVESLTVGERQQLEILRLLWLGANILILDEPTTGISANQKTILFATLKKLAAKGITILFVSHKLEDVEALCDRIAVLRQGMLVTEKTPPYDTDELVANMFGKTISLAEKKSSCLGDSVIKLENIGLEDYRLKMRSINLEVCQGEVIGLAGMEGSGQSLFLRLLAGLLRPVAGKILVKDVDFTNKYYRDFRNAGIVYQPAARLEEGLISGLTITEHFMLTEPAQTLFIDHAKASNLAKKRIEDYAIRGTPLSRVEQLSGGNQQRALLALLKEELDVILLEHPTRGLDIESAVWIWGKLKDRCQNKTAILYTSADLDEIIQYSDRILVFFGGKVSKPIDTHSTSVEELGQLIGGKGWAE